MRGRLAGGLRHGAADAAGIAAVQFSERFNLKAGHSDSIQVDFPPISGSLKPVCDAQPIFRY